MVEQQGPDRPHGCQGAQVTSRAKTPKSFDGKLRRIVAGNKKPLTDLDSVFVHVRDLAAVRIATYEARHEAQVVDLVCKRFHTEGGATPVAEAKDYQNDPGKRDNFYPATHVEACLPPADLVGTYANVARVPCEIQVCSMMATCGTRSSTTSATNRSAGRCRRSSAISSSTWA